MSLVKKHNESKHTHTFTLPVKVQSDLKHRR